MFPLSSHQKAHGVWLSMLRLISKFCCCRPDRFITKFLVGPVAYGCCNKLLRTWWLVTTEMYSSTGLEAGSPHSRCWQCGPPSVDAEENSSFLLPSSGGRWHSLVSPAALLLSLSVCGHIASSSLCVWVSSSSVFPEDTCHWIYPTWLIQNELISKPLTDFRE